MSPLLAIANPIALTIIGIMLNSFHVVHDQPQFSLETNPVDKLASERQADSRYFFLQRVRILQRQERIGQYGWLNPSAIRRIFMVSLLRRCQGSYGVKASPLDPNLRASRQRRSGTVAHA